MAARRAGVKTVAERAGVSVGTVSNVLNRPESVAEETRLRVEAAMAELNFVRNASARQLRAGQSTVVGAIVLDLRNPFYTALARGIEDRLLSDGLMLMMASSDENPDRERRWLRLFAGPGGLSGGPVAVQAGPGGGHPVAEALAGGGEVAVPADRGGRVLLRVVGTEPVQVQRAELPVQLGVPVPVGRDDRCGQCVGAAEPFDPPVEGEPFLFQVVGEQEVPVHRPRRPRNVIVRVEPPEVLVFPLLRLGGQVVGWERGVVVHHASPLSHGPCGLLVLGLVLLGRLERDLTCWLPPVR